MMETTCSPMMVMMTFADDSDDDLFADDDDDDLFAEEEPAEEEPGNPYRGGQRC